MNNARLDGGDDAEQNPFDWWLRAGVPPAVVLLAAVIAGIGDHSLAWDVARGAAAVPCAALLLALQRRSAAIRRKLGRAQSRHRCDSLRTAREFEDSERRSRVLADALPQLVAIVDRALRIVYVNGRCRAYAGRTFDAATDGAAAEFIHADDRPQLAAAQRAIGANAEFECELRLRRTDGAHRWHNVRAVPIENVAGEPLEWIVAATDIEDRKLAETIIAESAARLARSARNDRAVATGLREANRLLAMAEEMAHVGHYRLDLVANSVYWSDEVYRTYGLPTTEVPTLEWVQNAYHPDDRAGVAAAMDAALEEGRPFTFSSRIVRPDGTIRAVLGGGQVERAADGTIAGLFGVLQDVTDSKDAERERGKLSERVMLATKAGGIGIWEWNVATDELEWDSAMFALYGLEERRGVPYGVWLGAIDPRDREGARAEIARALNGGGFDTEFRIVRPNGEVRQIRATGTLLGGPGGQRMVGANWDISEVRALADELRAEKERAEHANGAKTEFLARMSHEIRTPMNGIIGFTTLVLDGELSAEQRRYVALLRDAGRSLLAIINDILDFSKLEAGRIELEHIPVNLSALVDGALSIVRGESLPKGITLRVDIAPGVPAWVSGDPTRLRQTLLNLLTNALKFTEHGSIRVSVDRIAGSTPEQVRFTVADTGIGIAPDKRHLLFGDFSQLEKSTTREYGGTGLGLAICKRLVQAMGGAIGVESVLHSGSTFWFSAQLPEIDAPALCAPEAMSNPIVARRILVADDNRVNQIVVGSLLTRDGHEVVLVENGAEAVEALRTGRFDLVLMDMQMPLMDGVTASRAIRALDAPVRDVPIVAVTANAMAEEVESCHAAGMNGHLAKPIDREQLRRAVARWTNPTHPVAAETDAAPPALTAPSASYFVDTPTLGIGTLLDIFDGNEASVSEIFVAALASIEADLARIARAAAERDMPAVVEAAHRMKGTSGSIRSNHVMEISSAIQAAAKVQPQTVNAALVRTLELAVTEFRRDLEAYRRHLATAG